MKKTLLTLLAITAMTIPSMGVLNASHKHHNKKKEKYLTVSDKQFRKEMVRCMKYIFEELQDFDSRIFELEREAEKSSSENYSDSH